MKDNSNTQPRQVQLITAVPKDSDIAVYQFVTTKKWLRGWGDSYLRINNDCLLVLFASDLTAKDLKVFHSLLYHCEWENIVRVSQSEIAAELGTVQNNISKSVRKLVNLDLLQVLMTDGRKNIYMLNPMFVLKSKAKNLDALIKQYEEISPGHQEEE